MVSTADAKAHVEVLIEACNAYYESVMLSLIFQDKESTFEDLNLSQKDVLALSQYLSVHNPSLLESIEQDFLALTSEDISKLTGSKESVQAFMDVHYRTVMHLRSCFDASYSQSERDDDLRLKKWQYAEQDFRGEMERFERDGQSFCLCLIRSDAIWTKSASNFLSVLKPIAKSVLTNLRSFDEAYRVGASYILVSLKHTDISGGVKFFERLQRHLENQEGDYSVSLSVSGCLTSPVAGQKFGELIQELQKDLDETCKDSQGEYIAMTEATDLQKFLKTE